MRRALRRYGPWLCVPAVGGMFVQGLLKFAAPAPRWDMLGWVAFLTVVVFLVWLVRRASGPGGREVRAPKWYYGRESIVAAGLTAAVSVAVCLSTGAMGLTPKVERILAADPVIRSSQVTEVTHVERGSRGPDTYTVRHRVRFDSGTQTVQSTLRSGPELSRGSTVWVLYVPGQPELGGETEEGRGELEALQGGRAESRMWFVFGGFLLVAALVLGMGLSSSNKPLTKGAGWGRLRAAPATAGCTGIARRRMQSLEPPSKEDGPELRQTSGPFVELAFQDGTVVRLFVHRSIEPAALARQLGKAAGTLYWDGAPPTRGADTTWALFVLDSGEELPGFVQDSESFTWQTAGTPVDRTDKHPLELRPVLHPYTWQPGVQSWGAPFTAGAVAALWAYGYYGSAGSVWAACGLALLAPAAKGMAGRRYFDKNGTESGHVDTDTSAHEPSARSGSA